MKSHQLVSKLDVLEKFHDSIRLANRDDRNRSCSSVKVALVNIVYFCDILIGIYLIIGHIDFSERPYAKLWIRTSVRNPKSERSDSG